VKIEMNKLLITITLLCFSTAMDAVFYEKISLDVWIQLLGMSGIIVSLIFVALQMRQSHQFALAAQQTARMEVFVDAVNTMSETGVSFPDFQTNGFSE
jgi:hypothetical protein